MSIHEGNSKFLEPKAVFSCQYCRVQFQNLPDALECSGNCYLSSLLNKTLSDQEWRPPLPIWEFNKWSKSDKVEFIRKIKRAFSEYEGEVLDVKSL